VEAVDVRLFVDSFSPPSQLPFESLLEDEFPVPEPTKVSSTLGTSTQGVFTFVAQGKKLQKQNENYQDDYVLLAQTG